MIIGKFTNVNLADMYHLSWLKSIFITLTSWPRNNLDNSGLTYAHAEEKCGMNYDQVGSLSKQEWECASLYIVFAFQKV